MSLAPRPDDPDADPAANTPYYRRVLHDLIDMGANLARKVHDRAMAPSAPANEPTGEPATSGSIVAFDRIARCVRRSVALARSLDDPAPSRSLRPDRTAARKRIIRGVEDVIQRSAGSNGETLYAELRDRMDAPDLEDDIAHQSVADIIADICRDLGLTAPPGTHPWKRRTPADTAALHDRAAAPPRETGLQRTPRLESGVLCWGLRQRPNLTAPRADRPAPPD